MKSLKGIICLTLIFAMVFTLCGCSKDVITGEQFQEEVQSKGFIVDSSSGNIISNATSGYRAVKDGSAMIVTFWTFENDEDASKAYESMYNPAEGDDQDLPGTVLEGDNYVKYTTESTEDYSLLSRVGNTLLYAGGDIAEKDTIKDIAESLGY